MRQGSADYDILKTSTKAGHGQSVADWFSNFGQAKSYWGVSGALKWGKCTNQHVKKLNHSGNNQLENAVFQYEFISQSNLKLQIYTVNLLVGDKYYIIYCINYISNIHCIYLEYFTILFSQFILSAKEPSPTVHCVLCGLNVTSQSEGKITMDSSWWQMMVTDDNEKT